MAGKPNVSDAVLKYRRGILYRDGDVIRLGHVTKMTDADEDVQFNDENGQPASLPQSKCIQFSDKVGETADGVYFEGDNPKTYYATAFAGRFQKVAFKK